uniref:Uncharacterized protein n=1 Tax=Siphoviridae sp. ctlgF9 TaxID=2825649 RepID=A0A8S5PV98_9CAUD|nr:MAG TPA: hypothetical protein [Siphoviridae sp. ctlgF9]
MDLGQDLLTRSLRSLVRGKPRGKKNGRKITKSCCILFFGVLY